MVRDLPLFFGSDTVFIWIFVIMAVCSTSHSWSEMVIDAPEAEFISIALGS
jgi:hypothetical protein